MSRVISPPRPDLPNLRQPLEDGERQVFEFFDEHLPEGWEIYVQPHLNGLRPDFVLLHPEIGIGVFEVKNWDLSCLERWMEAREGRAPVLMGRKDGKTFSLQRENPVEKVLQYRDEIRELYCPRLSRKYGAAVVTAGLIFPSADDQEIAALLQPSLEFHKMSEWSKYHPVSGKKALAEGNMARVFPEALRADSICMSPELANDLRAWLGEPDAPRTQRTPLELDEPQRRLAKSRTDSGYRRISGPAGSGKSHVLAARAANLVGQGKDVLVVSFNLTLLNYLADAAVRNNPQARSKATWLNFHHWCRRVCVEGDSFDDYLALWRENDDIPNERLCNLVASIVENDNEGLVERYDAILVDEGQDFKPEWWGALRKVCRPGGEMILAADVTQDVYGVAKSWTEKAMTGAGFAGNWAKLEASYRLPPALIEHLPEFGRRFLQKRPTDLPPLAQMQLEVFPCQLRWVQTSEDQIAARTVNEVWSVLKTSEGSGLSVSDVTVLVLDQKLGSQVVRLAAELGVRCIDTFALNRRDDRNKKVAFFMGDARVKVTTLHSFKGWESRALVICVDRVWGESGGPLLYSGLTRLKRDTSGSYLTVVCAESKLASYGRTWPDFVAREQ